MKPVVVGVFKTRPAAQSAAAKLVQLGIAKDKINILTPDVTQTELAQLPTQAAEQPGMGKAMGATVGVWWVGLRDTEKDTYQAHGRNFDEGVSRPPRRPLSRRQRARALPARLPTRPRLL
jgi:hypothetical protein